MQRELVIGGFYRHFKNKLYQVRGIAYHSETKEKMVVYQAMYGDFSLYVRPYDMFMSEVDHQKYPEVTQRYRFEQVNPAELESAAAGRAESLVSAESYDRLDITETATIPAKEHTAADKDCEAGENVDKTLMDFLDIETCGDKLKFLDTVKDNLTDKMIDAMAASLDVEVSGDSVGARYMSLRQVLAAHAHYECTRLRT